MNFKIESFTEKELGLSPASNLALFALLPLDLDRVLTDFRQVHFANQYLLATEQKKFASYSYEKRKMEWLGGRIAAKYAVLKMYSQSDWLDLEIEADEHGRPFVTFHNVTTQKAPDISISHSHGLAAALAVENGLCGMDIQKVVPSILKIRDRFALPAELTLIENALSESHSEEVLLTMLWAAKESLRKAANTSPLPGFLELRLTEAKSVPDTTLFISGTRLQFAGITSQVITGMLSETHHDFALAFTASP